MKKWFTLALLGLFLSGCTQTHTIIDWVDFIKFNDTTYYGDYTKELASGDNLGEVVSTVQFRVADNVTDSNYKTKNGDAAFHEKGTEIYQIKGMEGMYAVKSNHKINGYQIYREEFNRRFEQVDQASITKIEISEQLQDGSHTHLNTLNDVQSITSFLTLLNEGQEQIDFEPNGMDRYPNYYQILFYNDGPLVDSYSLNYDGETYYWYPFEAAVLDEGIGEFISAD